MSAQALLKQPRSYWSPEQRIAAANRCRAKSPWKKSTGPRTWDGKRISSQNALKHGRFSAETKSIRTWLCFISRQLKYIKAALRHHDFTKGYARKNFSQNELSSHSAYLYPHPNLLPLRGKGLGPKQVLPLDGGGFRWG